MSLKAVIFASLLALAPLSIVGAAEVEAKDVADAIRASIASHKQMVTICNDMDKFGESDAKKLKCWGEVMEGYFNDLDKRLRQLEER